MQFLCPFIICFCCFFGCGVVSKIYVFSSLWGLLFNLSHPWPRKIFVFHVCHALVARCVVLPFFLVLVILRITAYAKIGLSIVLAVSINVVYCCSLLSVHNKPMQCYCRFSAMVQWYICMHIYSGVVFFDAPVVFFYSIPILFVDKDCEFTMFFAFNNKFFCFHSFSNAPGRIRTYDHLIMSQTL